MKTIKSKLLAVVFTALFAIALAIGGTAFIGRGGVAEAESDVVAAYADEGDGIAPLAATALKRPVFYTESGTNDDGTPKFTPVAGGAYATSFTYSTTQSHFVQLQGYDPATMTFALSNTTYMAAVEDATAKTLTVTFKEKTAATLAASTYKITVKLKPDEESGKVENTWDNLFATDQIYEVAFNKLSVTNPVFYKVEKQTAEDGTTTTKDVAVGSEFMSVPYSYNDAYSFKIKGFNADLFTLGVSKSDVTYALSEDGTEVNITYPRRVAVNDTRYLRVTLKDAASMEWSDATAVTYKDYTIQIEKAVVKAPEIVGHDSGATNVKTITYTGAAQTVVFSPAISNELKFSIVANVSGVTASGSFDATKGVYNLSVTNAASYTVTAALNDTTNYMWENNATPNTTFTVIVNRAVIKDGSITLLDYGYDSTRVAAIRTITEKTGSTAEFADVIEYYDLDRYYSLQGVTSTMVTITGNDNYTDSQNFDDANHKYNFFMDMFHNSSYTNPIGTHSLLITPSSNYTWENGSTTAKTLQITVNRRRVALPRIINGETSETEEASANGIRSNNDTEITFYYTGNNMYAYMFAEDLDASKRQTNCGWITTSGNGWNSVISYNSSANPSGSNRFGHATYEGKSVYSMYTAAVGAYTLYLKLDSNVYYEWEDAATNSSATRAYVVRIVTRAMDKLEDYKLVTFGKDNGYADANKQEVSLIQDGLNYRYVMEYPLVNQYFAITSFQGNYIDYVPNNTSILGSGTLADSNSALRFYVTTAATVTTYNIALTPKTGYGWSDGTNGTRYLYIQVTKHNVEIPDICNGVWFDASANDGKGVYRDQDNNIVTDVTGKGVISKYGDVDYYNMITYEYTGGNVFLHLPWTVEDGVALFRFNDAFYNNSTSYGLSSYDENSGGNGVIRLWQSAVRTGDNSASIRIKLPDVNRYQWVGGSTGVIRYYLEITRRQITGDHELLYFGSDSTRADGNKQVVIDKSQATSTLNYTYHVAFSTTAQYFAVTDIENANYVTLSVNNATYIQNQGIDGTRHYAMFYIVGNVNPFTCVYTLTPKSNYCWEDGSTSARTVTIVVDKVKVEVPKIANTDEPEYKLATIDSTTTANTTVVSYTYDGANHPIWVSGYQTTAIITATFAYGAAEGTTGTGMSSAHNAGAAVGMYYWYAKNAGTYTYTFTLANTSRYEWEDADEGGAAARVFTLKINRKRINAVDHNLNYYGNDTTYNVNNKQTVVAGQLTSTVAYATSYMGYGYYNFSIDGLYDTTLAEAQVSVSIPAKSPQNYNDSFMQNVGANGTTGEWRFRINQYSETGYGSIIRTCYIYFTPTANYVWDDSATFEARTISIQITKRVIDVPTMFALDGDETDDDGNVTNGYGATYDETTRTATFTYQEGAPVGMTIKANKDHFSYISRTVTNNPTIVADATSGTYTFRAAARNTYTLSFSVSNGTFYEWNDATKTGTRVFSLVITRAKATIPTLIYTDTGYASAPVETGVTFNEAKTEATVEYRVSPAHYFNILGFEPKQMTISASVGNMSVPHSYQSGYAGYTFYINQGSGNYRTGTITFTVSPDANHEWNVDDGGELTAIQFIVKVIPTKIALPEFDGADAGSSGTIKTFTYNGSQQIATLNGAKSSWFTIAVTGTTGGTYEWQDSSNRYLFKATNAGNYTLTLTLAGNAQWDDTNATGTRSYSVVINRMQIEAPKIAYYGEDSTYLASNRVNDSDTGEIHITTLGNNTRYHYLTFEGYTHVTSTYFTLAQAESGDWQNVTWDNANQRAKLWLRQYSAAITRDAGWVFYLTPTANYCWKSDSSTTDFARKSYTVYVDKLEIEIPTVLIEDGDDFKNGYKTVVYNGTNQRISFLNFATEGISVSTTAGMTNNTTTETIGGAGEKVTLRNFFAINAGDYTITLSVTNGNYYRWKNNAANPVYHLVIQRAPVEAPKIYRVIDGNPVTDETSPDYVNQDTRIANVSYSTTSAYQFVLENYLGSTYYSATASANLKTALTGTDYFLNLAAGVTRGDYTLTLTLNANYQWKGEGTDAKVYTITIDRIVVSRLGVYNATTGEIIASSSGITYSSPYTGASQNIVFVPTVSTENEYYKNFSPDVLRVYNTYYNNSSYILSVNAGSNVTLKLSDDSSVTVKSAYMSATTVGTYDYRVGLLNDNYIWDDGSNYTTSRQFLFIITPKEIPRLEYWYDGEYKSDNTVIEEYSNTTRSVFVVAPKGSTARLDEYTVGINTSYFASYMQTTLDCSEAQDGSDVRPAYVVTVQAFAPALRTFTVALRDATNYRWTGESVTTVSTYTFTVNKKIIAEPTFHFVENAATEEDPTATKDTPISSGYAVEYSGNYYSIKFKGADSLQVNIGNISGLTPFSTNASTGASWNNSTLECIRTARDAGTYGVRVSIKYPDYYTWPSGETFRDYTFTINRKQIAAPVYTFTGAAYNSSDFEVVDGDTFSTIYTGANQFFKLAVDDTASVTFVTGTSNKSYVLNANSSQWAAYKYYYFYQTNVANYTVNVNLTDNYCWIGGSTDPLVYYFSITRKEVAAPEFDEQWLIDNGFVYTLNGDTLSVVYCNKGVTAHIKGYDTALMKNDYWWHPNNNQNNSSYRPTTNETDKWIAFNSNCIGVNNPSYPYKIQIDLKDTNNYQWSGGGTTALVYNLHITKQDVVAPNMYQITVQNGDDGDYEVENLISSNQLDVTYSPDGYDIRIKNVDKNQVTFALGAINWNNGSISGVNLEWADGSTEANYHLVTAGTYTIYVRLKNPSYFQWYGSTNTDHRIYTVVINREELALPTIEGETTFTKTVVYDGTPQTLKILNAREGVVTRTAGENHTAFTATWADGNVTYTGAIDVNTYSVTLGLAATNNVNLNYIFTNGSQTQKYTLVITPKPINVPYIINGDGLNDNGTVDGTRKTVVYTADTAGRSMLVRGYNPTEMTYTWNGTGADTYTDEALSELILKATAQNATSYSLTFTVTNNFIWNTTGGTDRAAKTLTLQITQKLVSVPIPTVTDNADYVSTVESNATSKVINLTFNGEQQGFNVTFAENVELATYISGTVTHTVVDEASNLHSYTAVNAATYYVRFHIYNTTNYKWADGQSDPHRFIYITIAPKTVSVPTVVANDEYEDSTSRWTGAYKYVDYNTGFRYLVIDGYDSNLINYSKTSSLNLLAAPSAPAEGEETDTPKKNYLTFYATAANTYTVTFTLAHSTNYIWETGNRDGQSVYLVINKKPVAVPNIEGVAGNTKSVVFNGENQSMTLSPWDANEVLMYSKTGSLSVSATNPNEFFAMNYLNNTGYEVRVRLTNYSNYRWADNGADDRYYYLRITPQAVDLPVIIEEDDKSTATYDHSKGIKTVTFNTYAQSIKVSIPYGKAKVLGYTGGMSLKDDSKWSTTNELEYQATDANTYTITFALESANYKWKDDVAYNNTKTLQLKINKIRVTRPTIVYEDLGDNGTIVGNTKTVEYNAQAQYMNINAPFDFVTLTTYNTPGKATDDEWKKNDVLNVWATDVNTYTFRFNLKNTNNMEWDNQTNSYVDIILRVDIKRMAIPAIEGYGSNMTQTVSYETDANGNAVTQYMYLTNIVDENIIKVTGYTSYSNTTYGTYRLNYSYDQENQRYVCSATDVFYTTGINNYSITLGLVNSNYRWTDGTTTARTYNLRIERKAIDLPAFYEVSTEKDEDGKDTEVLSPINSGKAIFEYDGSKKNVRLVGVLNNIIRYSDNSVATSSNGNKNGDLLDSYDPKTDTLNYEASHVYLNYYSNTIDYTVTLTLTNTKNYVWNDGQSGTGAKYFYIRINRKQIALPRIEGNTGSNMYYLDVPFNNQPQSFTLTGVDQNWMTATSANPTLFPVEYKDGDILVGNAEKDVRDNYVTLALKDTLNTTWTSTSWDVGNRAYHLRVQTVKMVMPSVVGNNIQKYTSDKYTFQYRDVWGDEYMTYTLSDIKNMSAELDAENKILTVTVAANAPITSYYVTFILKNYTNMQWNTSNATSNKSVYIYLQKAQVAIPGIVDNGTSLKKTVTYNGKDQKIALDNYLRDMNDDGTAKWMTYTIRSTAKFNGNEGVWNAIDGTMDFSAQNVGTYIVRVNTNSFCTFTDGSTYKDYTLEITKAIYDSPFFVDDGVGTTTAYIKTFTFNFDLQSAVMKNVINDVNVTDKIVWWRDITGYGSGTADDHRLKIEWDEESQSATISAQYVGTYYIRFQIADNAWANARWSTTTSNYIDYRIVVNRAMLTVPSVVRTGLATNESISGRYKYSTYGGNFITAQFKDIDDTYMTWEDLTNYAGKDDDHKAVFTYDKDTKVLTLKAKYVATYTFRVRLKDFSNTYWSGYSAGYNYTFDCGLVINKFNHAYPTLVSGSSASVTYTGEDVEFRLQNVVQGTDKYVVTQGELKEVSWDQGFLTLSAKNVGTYTVVVSIIDTDNSSWTRYTSLTFNFYINRKALSAEVTFSSPVTEVNDAIRNGSTSWAAGVPVFVNAAITGLNQVEGETVGINAYWYNANNTSVTTTLTETGVRRYALPTTLTKGTYYVVIAHAAAADNYTLGTYRLKFVINSDPARFTENDLVWQYSAGGENKIAVAGSHNTAGTALDLDYMGAAYQFSITLSDAELQKLNVRLVSYEGSTMATNYSADAYRVSVTIAAYDSAYYFPKTTYNFYYRINKAKFNLSQVKWDYSEPFTYDETAKNVEIDGKTLPTGLTVAGYTGSRAMVDATEGMARGYTTGVTFTVANQNYIVPLQSDPSTYTGDFSWTCEWQINKAPIDVRWKPIVKVDDDNMIFNIPVLIDSGEKVTYSYEKFIADSSYDEGGYWKKVEKVTYSTEEVTYRVTPKLTDGSFNTVNYAANYKLVPSEDATVAHEFTVGGEQIPVMFKVLINGKTGTQFPYTGSAYTATVTVDQDDEGRISVVENSVQVTYTRLSDGTNLGSTAPVAVGRYKVTITLSYNIKSAGDSASINSKVEDEFEIVKGTIDTSMLVWKIDHTGGNGACTYDAAQGKWIDRYGAEVDDFVYDGNAYTLRLEGADKLYGLTLSAFTGLTATEAGDYQAKFVMTYDANSWEAPDFSNVLDWSIKIAEINLGTASWTYGDPFVYDLADGSAVAYTVELENLPKQLTDMLTAGTAKVTYTGNTGSAAGTYNAKVSITLTNPNYAIVYPETLNDTLTWVIEQRKLTIPEAGGKWTEFDGKVHDLLIEVCGADDDWADYYNVSLKYSTDGTTYLNYTGYGSVPTDAYNAYYYELTLTIKDTVNTKTATNAVWENESADRQVVRFSIDKLTVTVTGWNGNYENSTAITDYDSIVKPDMLGYTITDADGKEYTKEAAEQLGGGITLTVKPYVVSTFASNINLAYVDDNCKSYEYVTEYRGLEWLDYPELTSTTADYDGNEHTFVIDNWDYYSDYLEFTSVTVDGETVSSASLRQTKAGTYTVYLKIKDTANASWRTTDGSLDRSKVIELSFTINVKMVKLPTVSDYDFTGKTINLTDMLDSELLSFAELTGTVSAINAGKYELTLKFKDADSCVWNDGSSEEKTVTWNINQKILSTPDAGGWTVFDGDVHNLVKDCGYGDDWNDFFNVTVEYSVDGEEFETFEGYESGKNYTAYKSGVYRIVFAIKEALNSDKSNVVWSNYTTEDQTATVAVSNYGVTVTGWNANKEQSTVKLSDGTTASTKFFEYIIRNSDTQEIVTVDDVLTAGIGKGFTIELAVRSAYVDYVNIIYSNDSYRTLFFATEKLLIEKPVLRFNSYEFNASERTFEIVDWATKYAKYLEMNQPAEYLKQTVAGNYEITLSFKENSVAAWADGSTDAYTLKFSITEKEIVKPALSNVAYAGSEINILAQYIADNGTDYVEIKSGDKGTNAGSYTLVIGLKYPESTKWQGGDNSDLTLNWTITQTKLVAPTNGGKWTVFDAANHDLLELCGVQTDWTNYYTVKTEYSTDGVTYGAFDGNFGYNAGNYKLTFHIKDGLNPDDANNVVWARTENTDDIEVVITVAKLEVKVIGWNESANDSTVKLESGSLPAGIVSYVFKDADGKQVDESDVLTAAKGVKFSKELVVSDSENVVVNYETAGLKRYYFVMSVHTMYVPQLLQSSIIYDGNSHTFIINDWDLYSPYVEIVTAESSSLTQQDSGKFTVKLHIKDTMISTWQDGSTDDVTLTFEITEITVDGRWDTKNLPNTFVVSGTYPADNNALVTVTYTDKDGRTADPDNLKEGETYTATVAIARSYAANYKLDENIELSVTFTMPINYEKLVLPTIKDASRPYNGKAQTFQIGYWATTYADYLDMDGSLTQTDVGKYEVRLSFKENAHATWMDGSTDEVTLRFEITGVTVNAEWDISGSAPVLDTSETEYAGDRLPDGLITYTFKDETGAVITVDELVADTTYYVTAAISADYRLNFTFASDVQKVYVFHISNGKIEPAELKKLSKPEIIESSKAYTGAELTFEIENWDVIYKQYLDIVSGSLQQTDADEYSVTLRFKDGVAAIWESGGMEDVILKFSVTARVIDGEWIFEEDGLEQPYLKLTEEGFALPEDLLSYVIKDADGNVITAIKSNVTYYITVSVTDGNYKLSDSVDSEKVFRLNTDNTLTEVTVKRMALPEFEQASFVYDGTAHEFKIVGFDEIADFLEVTGDKLTQTNVGKYKVTFHIKDSTVATWVGGTTGDYSLTFEVTARTTALPVDMPAMTDGKLVYTGSEITFEIDGWAEKYEDIIELGGDSLTQTLVGKYSVTLKIKDTSLFIWANGKLEDVTLTFEIVKAKVDGEWKLGDDVPYFAPDESVFGAYPEGMIEYTIADKDGNVLDYKDTQTCVTYYMTAKIVNDNFEFADGVETTFAFRYTEGNVLFAVEVERLAMPEFVESQIEFDGEAHTFVIKDWAHLSQYLEMSGANLTQTEVGEYRVTFAIIDTTLATWENGTTRTFSLTFAITERTSGTTRLEMPEMLVAECTYDGAAHTFEIDGWADLDGKVELIGDSLTQTKAGTYTVTLRIKNSVLYVWADGGETATVTFVVKTVSLKAEWVYSNTDVPYIEFKTVSRARGVAAQSDVRADDIVRYEITDYNGNVISADEQVAGVNYYITAVITDPNYSFEEGFETRFVYRITADGEIVPVVKTTLGEVKFVIDAIKYDGDAHTFEIADWDKLEPYMQVVGTLTRTEIGEYRVTLHIIDKTLATWENGTALDRTLIFRITEDEFYVSFDRPVIEIDSKEYSGAAQTFQISNWNELKKYVQIVEGLDALTQTEVGTYTVTLHIYGEGFTWKNDGEEGSTEDITLTFRISKLTLDGAWNRFNKVPVLAFNRDELPEDMLVSVITDRNGEQVAVDGLNVGETYLVTYAVNEKYENTYTLPLALHAQHFKVCADGNTELVDGFPAIAEKEDAGILTWLALVVSIILVGFLIALIGFMIYLVVTRNKQNKKAEEGAGAEGGETTADVNGAETDATAEGATYTAADATADNTAYTTADVNADGAAYSATDAYTGGAGNSATDVNADGTPKQ